MTPESELGTRNPFGGFMISPLDFLFNFDNFPLNDAADRELPAKRAGQPAIAVSTWRTRPSTP